MWRERKNVDCRVEVPQVQIIDEIVQAPFKKEVRPQEEFGDCPVEVRSATKEAVYYYSIGFDASGSSASSATWRFTIARATAPTCQLLHKRSGTQKKLPGTKEAADTKEADSKGADKQRS